jgi:mannose-6-phosphate isomerase-like protein (cupin superfamily)
MGHLREDQGFMTPLHVHPNMDEQLFVLEGTLSFHISGGWHDLTAGPLAVVPRGMPHAQGNRGSQPVLVLGAGNPAGFERVFAAQHKILSRIAPGDPQLPIEIAAILGRYDTQILGPPPP